MDTVIKNLNEGWKFFLGECEDAWYKGYDDSQWKSVMLPHDWSVEQPFSQTYSSGTGYLAGGIGWYRLRFTLPEEYRGKCIRVVFDGIYKNSQVWCNSYYIGKRPNGYITFSYDLTPFVGYGEQENEISVKVTHTDIADSRWFTGSGITRKVTLVAEEPVHPKEYGIYFQTKKVEKSNAQIEIQQELVNTLDQKVKVALKTIFVDKSGKEVLELREKAEITAKGSKDITMTGTVHNPLLWSIETPNLYQMKTYYSVDDAEYYLVGEASVGIRSIYFDPDKGFFLNGIETKMKGVCVHHDGGCLGAAMRPEIWQRRLAALKECGCNAIRCSHNPHMPELYELCDHMGFLMMDEAFDEWENAKNKWSTGHNVYPPKHQGYFEDFPQWHEGDLSAMVRRDRNHSSIVMWSIGNEIDYPNDPYCHPMFETMTGNNDANKPAAENIYDPNKPNAERLTVLAKKLAAVVRREDGTRPVTLAAAYPELSSRLGLFDALDVVGYNYKEHLYEEDHRRFPAKPFLGSENNHSYQAWRAVAENPFISGQFLWTGIDYLGEAHGWPIHGSSSGILTCAGYKKPEFYKRKSFWSKEKVLHIATGINVQETHPWAPLFDTWNYKAGESVMVKCFSNLPEVVLYLNGQEVGRQKGCQADGAFGFVVNYKPGELKAEAYDQNGDLCMTDTLVTSDKAERITAAVWKAEDEITGASWEQVSHSKGYLYQIELQLQDKDGKITVWDNHSVSVQVSGDGELAGLESGNLADVTAYTSNFRNTYSGRLTGFIRRTGSGNIRIAIESDILRGETYEMEID